MKMKMAVQILAVSLLLAVCEARYDCTGTRNTDRCDTYTIQCTDDFRLFQPFSWQRTCTGTAFFSESLQRCVEPSVAATVCASGANGGSQESVETRSQESVDTDDFRQLG